MNEFSSNQAPEPLGAYPHARQAGPFLILSGIGPRLPGSGEIPGNEYDAEGQLVAYEIDEQCHSVFRNVRAVLESCGARWEDLVDVTVYLTDMQRDFQTYNRIYTEYFRTNRPCRTTIEVGALPTPIAIELKCMAFIDH